MERRHRSLTRRRFLEGLGAATLAPFVVGAGPAAPPRSPILRPIPSTGERIPIIGLGTAITFDAPPGRARSGLAAVLQTFFDRGGTLVDSSPMYGAAEEVVGELLKTTRHGTVFAATKVWTDGKEAGIEQLERSRRLWGVPLDLVQIHNLRDWQVHVRTLKDWKAEGRIRYVGITTSHGRMHDELERAMRSEPFDFVQLSYNLEDREAERRLLPLAAERGIAVLANRPLQLGGLFGKVKARSLPPWAAELGIGSWAQYFLKFAVSHPAVTCAIPATSKVEHLEDDMAAARGPLPDAAQRERMLRFVEAS